jgi:N-acetylglucosaminyldiphosphoundecaprenol N-acetyl-beta-D-mannosaminyltransferase
MEFIEDIPISLYTNQEILDLIDNWLTNRERSRHIITLNALTLMASSKVASLKDAIQHADLVTVDGYGIEGILRKRGLNVERFTGVDLTRQLLKQACQKTYSVYFFGGNEKIVAALRKILPLRWPGLVISGIRDGYGRLTSEEAVFDEIICKQPHLLLVGLGVPRQALFLAKILPYLRGTVGVGIGGTFEVLCGLKLEAPGFIRNHGLEWSFRMLQEPYRLKQLPYLFQFWYRYLW